jgi:hypothetical protein
MTVAGVRAIPTRRRAPGPTAWCPGGTASVWDRPREPLGWDNTPVPSGHGAPTSSAQHRSPGCCRAHRPLAAFARSAGGEESAGPPAVDPHRTPGVDSTGTSARHAGNVVSRAPRGVAHSTLGCGHRGCLGASTTHPAETLSQQGRRPRGRPPGRPRGGTRPPPP